MIIMIWVAVGGGLFIDFAFKLRSFADVQDISLTLESGR